MVRLANHSHCLSVVQYLQQKVLRIPINNMSAGNPYELCGLFPVWCFQLQVSTNLSHVLFIEKNMMKCTSGFGTLHNMFKPQWKISLIKMCDKFCVLKMDCTNQVLQVIEEVKSCSCRCVLGRQRQAASRHNTLSERKRGKKHEVLSSVGLDQTA